MTFPGAIIFVNNDLVNQIKEVLRVQLFLDQIISGDDFDGYVQSDPNYVSNVKYNNQRILVVRSFLDIKNKELADVVIFIKNGLASIQKNNFGPPLQTYRVDILTLNQLLGTSSIKDIIVK